MNKMIYVFISALMVGQGNPVTANTTQIARDAAAIEKALVSQHTRYNEAERMIGRPFSSPGYHTTLKGGTVHPTRDSLNYALMLLDSGNDEYVRRAEEILERVIALQDQDRSSRTHGIWSWFLEEPLSVMSPPDWNWADFCGAALLQALVDHGGRLSPKLREAISTSLRHACESIKKRDVKPSYTNIAIMGAFVTLVAGERLGWADMEEYGIERVRRFHEFTMNTGWFLEYNSPTYTIVAIEELARLQHYARHAVSRKQVDQLLHIAWREIAEHFHPPSGQWTGPHSRAYRSLMNAHTRSFIENASEGRIDLDGKPSSSLRHRVPIRLPAELDALFIQLTLPREVKRTYTTGANPLQATTWLDPSFALGTINRGEMWNQRRNLIAYWGDAKSPAYLHLRVLRDGYDFSAATFHAAQVKGTTVFSLTFSTDGGNTHLSIDRLKNATVNASDLRVRFELGGSAFASEISAPREVHHPISFQAAGLPLVIRPLHVAFSPGSPRWEMHKDKNTLGFDLVLWTGESQAHHVASWENAALIMALEMEATPDSSTRKTEMLPVQKEGYVALQHGEFKVNVPLKPMRQRDLMSQAAVVIEAE